MGKEFDLSMVDSNHRYYELVIYGRMFKSQAYEKEFPNTLVRLLVNYREPTLLLTIIYRGKEYSFPAESLRGEFDYEANKLYIEENIEKISIEVGLLAPRSIEEQVGANFEGTVKVDRRKVKKLKRT